MDIEREFGYKGGVGMLKIAGVVVIVMAISFAFLATQPDNDMTILDYKLTPGQAMVAAFALALLLLGVGIGFLLAAREKRIGNRLALTPDYLYFPNLTEGIGECRIAYTDISEMSTCEEKGQRIVRLTLPGGTIRLAAAKMESPQAFEEMCALLKDRAQSRALPQPAAQKDLV